MTDNHTAMLGLAGHYAAELQSQWGTLNLFTKHGGEIGRAHEAFLRAVVSRFLPADVQLGTGFVATRSWTSRQTDLLLYNGSRPPLFKTGDLVVVDGDTLEGAIEVKTELDGDELKSALNWSQEFYTANPAPGAGRRWFLGLFATRGPTLETLREHLWCWARESMQDGNHRPLPHAIYVADRYVLIPGRLNGMYDAIELPSPEMHGVGLMAFVAALWGQAFMHRTSCMTPWWLEGWDAFRLEGRIELTHIPWPPGRRPGTQVRAGANFEKQPQ